MKLKHKQFSYNEQPYQYYNLQQPDNHKFQNHYQQINSKDLQYLITDNGSHFPLSTTQKSLNSKNSKIKKANSNMPTNLINYSQSIAKESPYRQLPSLETERKQSQNQIFYFEREKSVYEKMTENTSTIEYSQQRNNYYSMKKQIEKKQQILTERDLNCFQVKGPGNQDLFYGLSCEKVKKNSKKHLNTKQRKKNESLIKIKQNLREQIDQKLYRVCQKIGNLSRQKQKFQSREKQESKHQKSKTKLSNYQRGNNFVTNNVNGTQKSKLCYSSIVYEPSVENSLTPQSLASYFPSQEKTVAINNQEYTINRPNRKSQISLKQQNYKYCNNSRQNHSYFHRENEGYLSKEDNQIHYKIQRAPNMSGILEVYETKIIQLEKQLSIRNCKIVKLQADLLKEKQSLIKKEKQWLLRENQLLSWIEETQKQMQSMREELLENQCQISSKENVIIIDNQFHVKEISKISPSLQNIPKLKNTQNSKKSSEKQQNYFFESKKPKSKQRYDSTPSDAFLSQSYYPQLIESQFFQVSTKRNSKNNYQRQKYVQRNLSNNNRFHENYSNQSLSLSESKYMSTNRKKHGNQISTNKKSHTKQKSVWNSNLQKGQLNGVKNGYVEETSQSKLSEVKKSSKALHFSRQKQHKKKKQFYSNQVFQVQMQQSKAKPGEVKIPNKNIGKIQKQNIPRQQFLHFPSQPLEYQLYQMLSMQALAIQSLINSRDNQIYQTNLIDYKSDQNNEFQQSPNQDQEENLLSSNYNKNTFFSYL